MAKKAGSKRTMPIWNVVFLTVVCLIAVYDGVYVHGYPKTSAEGKWGKYFQGHVMYAQVDKLFQVPSEDRMLKIIIGPMGAVEIVFNLMAVVFFFAKSTLAPPMALLAHTFIFLKTLFYLIYDYPSLDLSDMKMFVGLYLLPNIQWLIFPAIGIVQLIGRIGFALQVAQFNKFD